MASASEAPVPARMQQSSVAAAIDRWIYVFMAALFFVTALTGFVPDSFMKIAMVEAGARAPFPPILHVHAVLMGAWLTLLLAQTTLMATGNARHHQKLGIASFLLAPAIVLTGIVLVPTMFGLGLETMASAPQDMQAKLRAGLAGRTDIILAQLRSGILFSVFVVLALRARRRDSGFHKRMIVLATLVPFPAAFARITWLPNTVPESPLSNDLYTLVWLAPMFCWDLFRLGRVHRAYLVWFALWLPATILVHLLWGSPWWQANGASLIGFG